MTACSNTGVMSLLREASVQSFFLLATVDHHGDDFYPERCGGVKEKVTWQLALDCRWVKKLLLSRERNG